MKGYNVTSAKVVMPEFVIDHGMGRKVITGVDEQVPPNDTSTPLQAPEHKLHSCPDVLVRVL